MPYTGSPVLARNMEMVKGASDQEDYDPRPVKYRNDPSYPDHFWNTVKTGIATTGIDMGFKYM